MSTESEPSVGVGSFGGGSGKVLIKVSGGAMTVLCAEPAIRSFKSKAGADAHITVCGDGCNILRNHSDIDTVVLSSDRVEGEFDIMFELSGLGFSEGVSDIMRRFALQLGVDLEDETPKVSLDSFDHIGCLKFGMSEMRHPRVGICIGSGSGSESWGEVKWNKLCSILEDTLDSQIIQLGMADNKYLGHGVDLIGKTSGRESVTVLSRVDLLVSTDEEYAMLARSVDTPCVLIPECERPVEAEEYAGSSCEEGDPYEASVVCVIDNIIDLCGNNSG